MPHDFNFCFFFILFLELDFFGLIAIYLLVTVLYFGLFEKNIDILL